MRTDPDSESIADQVLANFTVLPKRTRQRSELNGSQRYFEIFRPLLTSSFAPHRGRPVGPDSAEIATRQDACEWLLRQAHGKIDSSDWGPVAFTGGLRRIFVDAPKEIADCDTPYTNQKAGELIQVPHVVAYRRMEHRGWASELPPRSDTQMQDYRSAALCNVRNDRRANVGQRVAPKANDDEKAAIKDGTILRRMKTRLRRTRRDHNAPACAP